MSSPKKILPTLLFLPLWLFIILFKFGGGLSYTLLPTLGEKILPIWLVGMLIGASALLQLIADIPAGIILDRFGYVRMIRIGTLLFALSGVALLFGLTVWSFCALLLSCSFGWLFFGPGVRAYILREAPQKYLGRCIGLQAMFESVGMVLGMTLLPFTVHLDVPLLGLLLWGILMTAFLMSYWIPLDHSSKQKTAKSISDEPKKHPLTHLLQTLKRLHPASGLLCATSFSASTFYGIIWFVIPLVIAQQISSNYLSFGLSTIEFSAVILGWIIGYLSDHSNTRWFIFLGLLVFSVTGFFLGFNFNVWFLVLGFLATSGDILSNVSLWTWLNKIDTQRTDQGTVAGITSFFDDLGWTVGPVIAGLSYAALGPSWTIALGACLLIIVWLVSSILLHRPVAVSLKD